jgi:hypothetical protein
VAMACRPGTAFRGGTGRLMTAAAAVVAMANNGIWADPGFSLYGSAVQGWLTYNASVDTLGRLCQSVDDPAGHADVHPDRGSRGHRRIRPSLRRVHRGHRADLRAGVRRELGLNGGVTGCDRGQCSADREPSAARRMRKA